MWAIPEDEFRDLENVAWLAFKGWVIHRLMNGKIIPTILGKGWRFPGVGSPNTFWSFDGIVETVMAPLGVSFSLLIENQGLVKVDLSAILDPFYSNQFVLSP